MVTEASPQIVVENVTQLYEFNLELRARQREAESKDLGERQIEPRPTAVRPEGRLSRRLR
jgi:hypothetical protein